MNLLKSLSISTLAAAATLALTVTATPAQACTLCSGIKLNGVQFNGFQLNGVRLNGSSIASVLPAGTVVGVTLPAR